MRRAAALLVLFASCEWRGPTEPAAASPPTQRTTVLEEPLFKMDPERVTLSPGMSATVRVAARWDYPLGVAFEASDRSVAVTSGAIPPGGSVATLHINALRPGTTTVRATVPNFARPPGSHPVSGLVEVTRSRTRPRSVARERPSIYRR